MTKIYKVELNKNGAPNFATAEEVADRPMGEWVTHDCLGMPSIDNDTCSVCGQRFYQMAETGCEWHFCPNCGADMKREDDE